MGLNFSDCEGVIGPRTSAKLAKDFAAHAHLLDGVTKRIAELAEGGGHFFDPSWFAKRYADWRKAFELAADGGAVAFH